MLGCVSTSSARVYWTGLFLTRARRGKAPLFAAGNGTTGALFGDKRPLAVFLFFKELSPHSLMLYDGEERGNSYFDCENEETKFRFTGRFKARRCMLRAYDPGL